MVGHAFLKVSLFSNGHLMTTPKKKLGGALRVTLQEQENKDETSEFDLNEENLQTPTAKNFKSFEFNAPKFHDFSKEQPQDSDKWFGIECLM